MKINPKNITDNWILYKIILFYYRFLCVTFGGVIINKNGQIGKSKFLDYFGSFSILLITIGSFFSVYFTSFIPEFKAIYDEGLTIIYYIFFAWYVFHILYTIVVLMCLQKNGVKFFTMMTKFGNDFMNQTLVFIMWLSIVVIGFIIVFYELFDSFKDASWPYILFICYKYCVSVPGVFSISLIAWAISLTVSGFLDKARNDLLAEILLCEGNINSIQFAFTLIKFNSFAF